jgi:sugar lactone lactonase YvrE
MNRSIVFLIPLLWLTGAACGPVGGNAQTPSKPPVATPAVSELEELFSDNKYQLTGVAVSAKGRLFTNYPIWSPVHKYSVVEVTSKTDAKPYPNEEVNRWKDGDDGSSKFVSVQAVYVDDQDNLWVVDSANPGFAGVYQDSDKLVRINLETNEIERIYPMKGLVDKNRYLNDVRVDTKRQIAYVTNSNAGGIVIVDLESGKLRMVLNGAPPTQSDPSYKFMIGGREVAMGGKPMKVSSDGLALTPDGEWLFFKPLTDDKLYKVKTADLNNAELEDSELTARVVDLGHFNVTDGMEFDRNGNLYMGDMEKNSIIKLSPALEKTVLITDARLVWPDSYAVSKDGYLYISTSQIHTAPPFNDGVDRRTLPYGLFRLRIDP